VADLPGIGPIRMSHLPLAVLRAQFPEDHAALAASRAYAVCREPEARFVSSVAQYLREHRGTELSALAPAAARDEVRRLIDALGDERAALTRLELNHFQRQVDFVFEEGGEDGGEDGGESEDCGGRRQVVGHVYPIEAMAALARRLMEETGLPVSADLRSNETLNVRSRRTLGTLRRLNATAGRMLPRGVHARLRQGVKGLVSRGPAAAGILDAPELRDFVARRYAADRALYDECRARLAAGPA